MVLKGFQVYTFLYSYHQFTGVIITYFSNLKSYCVYLHIYILCIKTKQNETKQCNKVAHADRVSLDGEKQQWQK